MRLCQFGALSAVIASAMLLQVLQARADSSAVARKAIEAQYAKRSSAASKKDLKGMMSSCTPDFVYVTQKGEKGDVNLLKRRLSTLFAVAQTVKASSTIQTFSLHGKEASLKMKTHIVSEFMNPDTQQPAKLIADDSSEDTWIKTAKGWFIKREKSLSDKITVNGKSVKSGLQLDNKTQPK